MKFITDSLGLNASYFSNVEAGKTSISSDRLEKIAQILGTNVDYLKGDTYYPYPNDSPNYQANRASYDAGLKQTIKEISEQMNADLFCDRCEERRLARHLTHGYIETYMNLPEDFWEDVRTGFIVPDAQMISRFAILFNTTPDYLIGQSDDPAVPINDKTGVKIKVFGDVAAGIPIDQIDNFDPDDPDAWEEINRWTAKNGTYFALKIKGDSMNPRFLNGDIVIVRQQPTAETGEIAVVAVERETATCKKISWDKSGGLMLLPLNPNFTPSYYSAADIQSKPVRILGKVVELRGKC